MSVCFKVTLQWGEMPSAFLKLHLMWRRHTQLPAFLCSHVSQNQLWSSLQMAENEPHMDGVCPSRRRPCMLESGRYSTDGRVVICPLMDSLITQSAVASSTETSTSLICLKEGEWMCRDVFYCCVLMLHKGAAGAVWQYRESPISLLDYLNYWAGRVCCCVKW